MTKRRVFFIFAITLLFVSIFASRFTYVYYKMSKFEMPVPVVSSFEVIAGDWQDNYRAIGSFQAFQGIDITPETAGIVEEIHFTSGQKVAKGELLLEINDAIDRANLQESQVQLDLAKINMRRQNDLANKNATTQSAIDDARTKLKQTEANLARNQAIIEQKNIKAPFSGILGIRNVNKGQYITPSIKLVGLYNSDLLFVDFSIPEGEVNKFQINQNINAKVSAYPSGIFSGKIKAIDAKVDANTHNIKIRAKIENPDNKLYQGMFADLSIEMPLEKDVIAIPQSAIVFSMYGDEVYVIKDKTNDEGEKFKVVERRAIKTGEQKNSVVKVLSGLEVGEYIVDAGHVKLHDEARIEIAENNNENLE